MEYAKAQALQGKAKKKKGRKNYSEFYFLPLPVFLNVVIYL